jgi:paraquat-inducible protein B
MEGEYFHLISTNGDSVSSGMPVYYKNIKVGQVEYVYLSLNKKSVDTIVFIDKQYSSLVHDDSKFWIKSTFNVDFTKGNLDVNIAPVNVLLQGGIVFSSSDIENNDTLVSRSIFPIYKSKTDAETHTTGIVPKTLQKFILHTDLSTANLKTYSPVRFYEYDIGWVDEITINYDKKTHKMLSKILIALDISVFTDENEQNSTGLENLYSALEEGLHAKLNALDPISGMLYVDLTFDHNEGNVTMKTDGPYVEIPMIETYSPGVMASMTKIMDKINDLPLDKLVRSLDKVINETSEPIANANEMLIELKQSAKQLSKMTSKKEFTAIPDDVSKILKELTRTIKTTQTVVKGYGSESILNKQLSYTLEILTKTSKEMEVFLRMLNRKPNSLIFGDN